MSILRFTRPAAVLLLVACFALSLVACTDDDNDGATPPATSPTDPTPTPTTDAPDEQDMEIELTTGQNSYQQGAEVRFSITATNTSGVAVELEFPTSQRFDIEVEDADGDVVWRWSDGRVFTQAIEYVDVGDGESLDYEAVWDQLDSDGTRVQPGDYTARAVITATQVGVEATAEFTIED